jgi:aspartyl-tRNA synthetase
VKDWRRTRTCGELDSQHIGESVVLNGWVHARRDHGGIYFVDLRDRYGITQLVLGGNIFEAVKLSAEDVIAVRGKVVARDGSNVNKERPTGWIEIDVEELDILSKSLTPPFEVSGGDEPAVETRLRYRYIDLRRESMQKNILHRAKFISAMRRAFDDEGFCDIETPILTKATPEGARDYLVPSRVHPGSFYALPQSPQIFKQLLQVSGFDRYYQVARCFRDEDLRADRQPDFTQLDMEMSFVEEEDVYGVWERILVRTFRDAMGVELSAPFQRMRYDEAMERFGSDKPDLRFDLELKDVADWARKSDFGVFRGALDAGGRVMGLCLPGGAKLSRKEITALEVVVKEYGAKGLAWWKAAADGGAGPLARFCAGNLAGDLMAVMGAAEGDLCLLVADRQDTVRRSLGELRKHLAEAPHADVSRREGWAFLWVTHFPMFERDEEAERWVSLHHPFTAPEAWEFWKEGDGDLSRVASRAYDLVANGWELGSGSIRIHRADVQTKVFEVLGIGPDEARDKFGFLLEALSFGAPPHGGFALGLDRMTALTAGLDNIRDIIAFPKTTSAVDLMCGAPSAVPLGQLEEVHVRPAGRALARVPENAAPRPKTEASPGSSKTNA